MSLSSKPLPGVLQRLHTKSFLSSKDASEPLPPIASKEKTRTCLSKHKNIVIFVAFLVLASIAVSVGLGLGLTNSSKFLSIVIINISCNNLVETAYIIYTLI
jgi:hypothetical protein